MTALISGCDNMYDNPMALSGCFVQTGNLARGQILVLLWDSDEDEPLTWLTATESAFFQVVDTALDHSYVTIQRYFAQPGQTEQFIGTDTSYLVAKVVTRVFVLNESGLRHLPAPNHALELTIPPVPGASLTSGPSMALGSTFTMPFSDARGRSKTEETCAIHHLCNGDLNKVEELLGCSLGTISLQAAFNASLRSGDLLRVMPAFSAANIKKLLALLFSFPSEAGSKDCGWYLPLVFSETTTTIRNASGISYALGLLGQVLTAIHSPPSGPPFIVFDAFVKLWQKLLLDQQAMSISRWDPAFLLEYVMKSLVALAMEIKKKESVQLSQVDLVSRLSKAVHGGTPIVYDFAYLSPLYQQHMNVLQLSQVFQHSSNGQGNQAVARGGGRVNTGSGRGGGRGSSSTAQANASSWTARGSGRATSGSSHGGRNASSHGVPSAAPQRTGNRLCMNHILQIMSVPGNKGPCRHTPCKYDHISIPNPCDPGLRARLNGFVFHDPRLKNQFRLAVAALP